MSDEHRERIMGRISEGADTLRKQLGLEASSEHAEEQPEAEEPSEPKPVKEEFGITDEEQKALEGKGSVDTLSNVQLEILITSESSMADDAARELHRRSFQDLRGKQQKEIEELRKSKEKSDQSTEKALKERIRRGDTRALSDLFKSRGIGFGS